MILGLPWTRTHRQRQASESKDSSVSIRLVPPGGIGAELGVGSELVPGTRRRTEESLDSEACLGEGSRSFQNRFKKPNLTKYKVDALRARLA